jgi:hypothetical protein
MTGEGGEAHQLQCQVEPHQSMPPILTAINHQQVSST